MTPFRGIALQVSIAALLLVATWGALGRPAAAQDGATPSPPVETTATAVLRMPVPVHGWLLRTTVPPTTTVTATPAPTATVTPSPTAASGEVAGEVRPGDPVTMTTTPTYYVVLPGDTLFVIATDHGTTVEAIMASNGLTNADVLHVGQVLVIPGADGTRPDPAVRPVVMADGTLTQTVIAPRAPITERMTSLAQQAATNSPFYKTTWLTYYGRPNIDVMGILGEHAIADLVPLLRAEANAYEQANGDALAVMPAFHLVYGMATKAAGDDNSHLAFMDATEVISYIEAAEAEGWGVILDVQIGALAPRDAITPALAFLEYPNVHLAIDPEFAMAHRGQVVPGNPIGFVTAAQVNEVQAVIDDYLVANKLPGPRILLVHQFQSDMIVDKEKLDVTSYPHVALTLSVDGWGGPWGKISKYNSLVDETSPFTAFKLFYRWDEPLLLPDEALGNYPYRGSDFFMDVTPNLIIYQ